MTAEALLMREYLGWKHDDPRLVAGIDWITSPGNLIDYKHNRNVYYWYYATQAAFHMGGEPWKRWNAVMRKVMPEQQIPRGKEGEAGTRAAAETRKTINSPAAADGSTSPAFRSTCSKSTIATCRSTRASIPTQPRREACRRKRTQVARPHASASRLRLRTLAARNNPYFGAGLLGGVGIGFGRGRTRTGGAGNCSGAGVGGWGFAGNSDGVGIGGGTIVR